MSARFACLNPSTPKSDWHLIFPYNVNPESNIKVMIIKEVIILKMVLIVRQFSLSAP